MDDLVIRGATVGDGLGRDQLQRGGEQEFPPAGLPDEAERLGEQARQNVDVELEANPTGHMDPDVAAMGQALDKGVVITLTARGVKVDDMD